MEINIRRTNISKIWHKKGYVNYYHREDGPAIEYNNGEVSWYLNNTLYINMIYSDIEHMPLNLFLAYCKWEYKKNVYY